MAKNVVAAGLADRCEVQLAYAIGVAHPVSIMVETFGTGKVSDHALTEAVSAVFDLRPGAFRKYLDLHRPIYQQTAAYGHFGRDDVDLPWERLDKVEELKDKAASGDITQKTRSSREKIRDVAHLVAFLASDASASAASCVEASA